MRGRTHFVIGTAAALWLSAPMNFPGLAAGAAAAAAGAVISDLDEESSHAGRRGARTAATLVAAAALVMFSDLFLHTGVYAGLVSRLREAGAAASVLIFILLCAFGYLTEHRSFLHSLAGGAALTLCVRAFCPAAAPYFLTGFVSHLCLDLLNRKGLRLFYPLRKRVCLGWFRADGIADLTLFVLGSAALALEVWRTAPVRELAARLGELAAR